MRARTSSLIDDQVEAGTVRDLILASWTRSREWDIRHALVIAIILPS